MEGGVFVDGGVEVDGVSVVFDDDSIGGEVEVGVVVFGFGGEEGLEDFFLYFFVYVGVGVGDGDY